MILQKILQYILNNPEAIGAGALVIFEVILRRKPTSRDYSIINFIKRIIDAIATNKRKDGGKF